MVHPKTSVLIVEDEGLIALDLKRKLEQYGYSVPAIADNADDAIAGVEHMRPDLVLMDIRLRGPQDGIETADRIRRQFQVPVMYVTAHADLETLERAKITEPFGYIVKPFHAVDFRAQIEMALWKQKMEQRLRTSEAWLSAICRNVADALISTDNEGKIAFMNAPASDLTGWGWREARGKPLLEVFQAFEESTGLPVVHPLESIYDGREVASDARTFRLRSWNGAEGALVEARLSANYDGASLLGIIVVFREVTARRRAEEQYRQLLKASALTQMANGLGGDLSDSQQHMDAALSQLAAALPQLTAPLSQPAAGDGLRGDCAILMREIQKRATHQRSLVHDLLSLGETEIRQPVRTDLNAVIGELEPRLRRTLGIGRFLNLNLQPDIAAILVDPQEMKETLIRLTMNARNSLPDGGLAEIATSANTREDGSEGVRLAVWDNGKDVRANAKERVFDPYYESRPGIGGPGFSLALAHHFAELSGGTMRVESGLAEGTAYVLNFPAALGESEGPGIQAAGASV